MSLAITFHRAANAEFIEASVWYESKRLALLLSSWLKLTVAYRW